MLGKFNGHLPGQRNDGAFGRAVGGTTRAHRTHARHRRDIDNAAPLMTHHQARGMLAAEQGAGHVDVHGAFEFFERKIDERRYFCDARAIDQNVAAAVFPGDRLKRVSDRAGIADIDHRGAD